MRNKFILLTLFLFLNLPFLCYSGPSRKAITYHLGSRLGDNLLDYTHAKWISYKWGIPLLYNPFEYSDQFVFHLEEKALSVQSMLSFYHHCQLTDLHQLDQNYQCDTLYYINHFPDSFDEYTFLNWEQATGIPYVQVNWSDETFRNMMRKLITPVHPLKLTLPPKEIISVALHFRTGYDYDSDETRRGLALRFPPFQYYVNQLKRLREMIRNEPLYVYIFTDHPNPQKIKTEFEKNFDKNHVKFDCRTKGNFHNQNVLEDLFSMMRFDCIIRPISHYSTVASHLGDFKIEIFPKNGYWEGDKFIVSEINIIKRASRDRRNKIWVPHLTINQISTSD